jgi:hypothetical protein
VRLGGHVARMGMKNVFKILVLKLLGKPKHRLENNIKMNFKDCALERRYGE